MLSVSRLWFVGLYLAIYSLAYGCHPTSDGHKNPNLKEDDVQGDTIIVLPDTQGYSERHPEIFHAQTDWIAANVKKLHIKYVIHLGDIVNGSKPIEWENAVAAMSKLDNKIPYALVPGNHDYELGQPGARETVLNQYFKYDVVKTWPSFGGAFEEGSLENTFHNLELNGKDWVILCLEWAPRDAVLDWANKVLEKNSDKLAIVVTHAYINDDGHYYNRISQPEVHENGGKEIWLKLVSQHRNVVMTLNGHVIGKGAAYSVGRGVDGHLVHQMLSNYQMLEEGGRGYLRILEFKPDGGTVSVNTYSPHLDSFLEDKLQKFELEISK